MRTLVFCKMLLLSCLIFPFKSIAQKKPNVIFIAVDDMSIAFDAFGDSDVHTPNFARLMQHGMLFKQTYCQYAMCSPSRTSLLSGKRPDSTGVTSNTTDIRTVLGANFKFLPEYFHDYNYHTQRFGKISCDHEDEISWDSTFDLDFKHYAVAGDPIWWIDTASKTSEQNVTGQITAALVNKLKQPIPQSFFYGIGLSTHNPYTPILSAWNKTGDSSEQRLLPVDNNGTITNVQGNGSSNIHLPNTPVNDTDDIPPIAINKDILYKTDPEWRDLKHAYYAEVSELDDHLGVLLDQVDSLNLWDNTIVVFWSDHGIQLGEHEGLWLKKTLFEEALRVPFVICAPGKRTGICNKPVELIDIFSTLTELCGLPTSPGEEGSSLVPLLENPNAEFKKAVFAQVSRPVNHNLIEARAARTDNFHYNSWIGNGEELYDVQADPFEYTNLINNPAYADTLNEMRTILANGWSQYLPQRVFYKDQDGDGYGNLADTVHSNNIPSGYVTDSTDCNDTNANVHPGAVEICNGIDDNCDGRIDENTSQAAITPTGTVNICKGSSATLSANSGAGITYQWLKNGVPISGATHKSYVTRQAGNYKVTESSASGCTATSEATTVIVNDNPGATIKALGNLNICSTGSVKLQSKLGSGYTYQWELNATNIAGATDKNYIAAIAGNYSVTVTNSNGCSKSSAVLTVTNSCGAFANDSNYFDTDYKLSLSPDPSHGNIKVTYNSGKGGRIELKIFDIRGRLVFTKTEISVKGSNIYPLNLPTSYSGVYYLELSEDNVVNRIKFICTQ